MRGGREAHPLSATVGVGRGKGQHRGIWRGDEDLEDFNNKLRLHCGNILLLNYDTRSNWRGGLGTVGGKDKKLKLSSSMFRRIERLELLRQSM